MFCGKCGKQLEDDEVVCPWCGEATGVEVGEKRYSQQPENGGYGRNTKERSYVNREPVKPMALLGISVGLAAMMIYFSGLISNTILVVAAGYVLLKEEDRRLRAVAAKAILIVCIFGAIAAGITMVENGISGFNYLIMMVDAGPLDRMAVQDLCSFLNYACLIVRDLVLLIAGIQAFHCNNFRVGFIDRMINRNIQK